MNCSFAGCVAERLHAKGLCKRHYLRAFNRTEKRKALRRAWIARNRERVLESYRTYNRERRHQGAQKRTLYPQAVVRVPVAGWGYVG